MKSVWFIDLSLKGYLNPRRADCDSGDSD
jgi:hypothetical protein